MFTWKSYARMREVEAALYGGPRDLVPSPISEDYSNDDSSNTKKLQEGMVYHQLKIDKNNVSTQRLMKCIEGKLVEVKIIPEEGLVPIHCF